ncbi:GMC oxidoreductase [Methylobacterium organophilum]|uniref:6'''-hydroxyparomomycin C oxidase n=1 Tax=Methylobacterium organophilum TaxID=410 RepID=A0ABQ4TCB5_METOR|nr:GMC family oxidoreductase [Methylobacterium organophilum]GJE28694.1 6'''-hydroxyparomomycin C oxidase [Methylobacterium organophilum]
MRDDSYDVIIIGSGPGGGSAAWRLAKTGKRVLVIERGDYLPRERENWDTDAVFRKGRYQADETWVSSDGARFKPGLHYFVGGNSKVYGGVLFRLRESDFEAVRHPDGSSPEWPLKYDAFAPWYQDAEELFQVHGARGEDPTEPPAEKPYPKPAISHEPRIQKLSDDLARAGFQPFHLPMGALMEEDGRGGTTPHSPLLRCDPFDGYPSLTNGKADAQIICIDPTLAAHPNVTLLRNAYAERLVTEAGGGRVTGVEVVLEGRRHRLSADIVVVACGALSSALLFLRSSSDAHPNGLANGSGQVGRNYMRHNNTTVLAISKSRNPTQFQKTLGLNDFYYGHDRSPRNDWEFPLGHIQMVGKSDGMQIEAEGLPGFLQWLPTRPFSYIAEHSIDFWLTSEDLPRPENRIFYRDGLVHLDLAVTNGAAQARLRDKLRAMCDDLDIHPHLFDRTLYLGKDTPIGGTAHQAGTLRFGPDPATSVLDLDCRAHGIDNLYVTDASFFPSIGAVNPTLTIIANALRVADGIAGRL